MNELAPDDVGSTAVTEPGSAVRQLTDSAPDVDRAELIRQRAESDGYLFVSGLIDGDSLNTVRADILAICRAHHFVEPDDDVLVGTAVPGVRWREGDREYFAAYDEIQRLESFHRLAHSPRLLALLEVLFGSSVLVHPRNIARVMFPNNNQFTTPAHQDYVHIQGTPNTWTAWFPLGDCPRSLGSLEVLPGSHRAGPLPVRAAYGAGGLGVQTDHLGLKWVGGDFKAGDVLLFHSLTVHRGTPNQTPDQVRLSVDFRYQSVLEPVTEASLLPHFNRLSWDEIYQGWSPEAPRYYWRKLPLTLVDFSRRFHDAAARGAGS